MKLLSHVPARMFSQICSIVFDCKDTAAGDKKKQQNLQTIHGFAPNLSLPKVVQHYG